MKYKLGDKVKTIVSPFSDTVVRHGEIAYIHLKDKYVNYIVDFGDTWGGFQENQIELDDERN